MMNSILIFFALGVFSCVRPAVILIDQVEIPGHENQCYDKDGKVYYNQGDLMKNDGRECAQTKCLGLLQETGKLRVEVLTCPIVEAGPGCALVQDPSKPYPDCCPQVVSMPSVQPKICELKVLEEK